MVHICFIKYFTGPMDRFFESEEQLEYQSLRFETTEVVHNHPGFTVLTSHYFNIH